MKLSRIILSFCIAFAVSACNDNNDSNDSASPPTISPDSSTEALPIITPLKTLFAPESIGEGVKFTGEGMVSPVIKKFFHATPDHVVSTMIRGPLAEGESMTINFRSHDMENFLGFGTTKEFVGIKPGFIFYGEDSAFNPKRHPYHTYLIPENLPQSSSILTIKNIGKYYECSLITSGEVFSTQFEISNQDKIQILLPNTTDSEKTITITDITFDHDVHIPETTGKMEKHPYWDTGNVDSSKTEGDLAENLVLESLIEPVTQKELVAFKEFLLDYPTPKSNKGNSFFRRFYMPYAYEWMYDKTANIELINKMIDHGRSVYAHRNDNFRQYPTVEMNTVTDTAPPPIWPHFQEAHMDAEGVVKVNVSSASGSGVAWLTVLPRLIANHPELHDTIYQGMSYRDIAVEFANRAWETYDFYYNFYHDPAEDTLKYPSDYAQEDRRGEYLIWNRVLPTMAHSIPLLEATEKLNNGLDKPVVTSEISPKLVNTINKNQLEHVFRYFSWERTDEDGDSLLEYPYAPYNWEDEKREDFGHGSFDGTSFQLLYHSGLYGFDEKTVSMLANSLVKNYIVGPGHYYKWPGNEKSLMKDYNDVSGMEGYIWYARWRPEVLDNIVDYMVNGLKVKDSRVFWEVLKLRDAITSNTPNLYSEQ